MCVILYHICKHCQLGYPGHTLYCEHFRPPLRFCPQGTMYKFVIVEPEQCYQFPSHMQMEATGSQYVNTYDANGQFTGQRPCIRFVPAGATKDPSTSQQQQQHQPASRQQLASQRQQYGGQQQTPSTAGSSAQEVGPTGHVVTTPHTSAASLKSLATMGSSSQLGASAGAVGQLRQQPSSGTATNNPKEEATTSAATDTGTSLEFADQHQRINALLSYRGAHAYGPGRGRGVQSPAHAGVFGSGSGSGSGTGSHLAASNKRSSSVPPVESGKIKKEDGVVTGSTNTDPTNPGQATAAPVTGSLVLDPSQPPFYPQKRPGTARSWAGLALQDKGKGKSKGKGKGKETAQQRQPPSSSLSDTGSRAPSRPGTPVAPRTPPHLRVGKLTNTTQRRESSLSSSQRSRLHVDSHSKRPASAHAQYRSRDAPTTTTPTAPIVAATSNNETRTAATKKSIKPSVEKTATEHEERDVPAGGGGGAQNTTPSSPALSSTTTTATAAPTETRSPSAQSLALTEASEFPSLQEGSRQPPTPTTEPSAKSSTRSTSLSSQPAVRSWASIVGPGQKQRPLPSLSTLQPHESVTPIPSPAEKHHQKPQQQQKQEQSTPSSKVKTTSQKKPGQGAVTIGRSYTMERAKTPPPDEITTTQTTKKARRATANASKLASYSPAPAKTNKDDNHGAKDTKPKRSYSAVLTSGGDAGTGISGGPTKPTTLTGGNNDDWPSPPAS